MKRSLVIICLLAGVVAFSRPLYLYAITDCERLPVVKYDWIDPTQVAGALIAAEYQIKGVPATWTMDVCINDPNLTEWVIESNAPIDSQTVTWSGDKGVHYLYFQMFELVADASSGEKVKGELLDEATIALKCVPRGQFKSVTWK